MRTPKEIAFRLRQEGANLRLLAWPPSLRVAAEAPLSGLPDPDEVARGLRGTAFEAKVLVLSESVLGHRFPLLGTAIETGPRIDWRRDYISGVSTGTEYFRRIPYLDPSRAGDHKIIWELNRHQHLVLLAQAHLLRADGRYIEEIERQVDSWMEQNPFQRGINWASALEVAFRALSWTWVYHLAGRDMDADFRARFLTGLYRHGRHLERNLSIYFSPNTHLLGEAVALHGLGALFPGFPEAERWRRTGARIVREQMDFQVREDGSHFEQSSYYHVYALDMFVFHHVMGGAADAAYLDKLGRMAGYLAALMGPGRRLPFLGDDDGGRFFHPYGERDCFGRATLATCGALLGRGGWSGGEDDLAEQAAWWLGPERSRLPRAEPVKHRSRQFRDSGVVTLESDGLHVVFDCGTFGHGSGGHSHADTLSIVVTSGEEELLVDAGAYTYVGDAAARDWFRGVAAHNTVRVNGRDQATAGGAFRWIGRPVARILYFDGESAAGECTYDGVVHRRTVIAAEPRLLLVIDEIEGSGDLQLAEQFWHPGQQPERVSANAFRIGSHARLELAAEECEIEPAVPGWRSRAFGVRTPSPYLRVSRKGTAPVRFATILDCSEAGVSRNLALLRDGVRYRGAAGDTREFPFLTRMG